MGSKIDIRKHDKHMQVKDLQLKGLAWFDPKESPFRVSGLAYFDKEKIYRRLPLKPKYSVSEAVESLCNCTAGGQISFRSDTRKLAIKVDLTIVADMDHMPATGQCGFDCYVGNPGERLYFSTIRYNHHQLYYEYVFFDLKEAKVRNITLNMPLYGGVKNVWLGMEKGSKVLAPVPYSSNKRVIIYGTSITQGGCACRPGMAYTNILSRRFNREFINLGFSGSGKGEPEMAKIISEIENPGCFVLDYEANSVSTELFERTLPEFVGILRRKHKKIPILVVSTIKHARENFGINEDIRLRRLEIQKKLVFALRSKGDKNIHFYNGAYMMGKDFYECTVDGIHPTDLGFMRIADSLTPVLMKILAN